eukprot:TRINITY_DN39848_c0_g1_i1.p1 TRINITY_DN39848_c0_g1~~TRINITY_DN39848_c0_g1_i1.p1  ORF type:complete len:394 (+),score=98.43 TRINITY_DN39848_c0_g1_i1:151-1332(+)
MSTPTNPQTYFVEQVDMAQDADVSLSRTMSQQQRQKVVQQIQKRLHERAGPVNELVQGTRQLVTTSADDAEVNSLEQLKKAIADVEALQRNARHLGEDLLEDMLALDNLESLFSEDRLQRKGALGELETLTEKVDHTKSVLAKRKKELEQAVVTAAAAEQEKDEQIRQKQQEVSKQKVKKLRQLKKSREGVHQKQEQQRRERSPVLDQSAEEDEDTEDEVTLKASEDAEMPRAKDWAKLKLPLELSPKKLSDSYIVTARVKGLDLNDLQIELVDDGSTVQISGLCVPDARDVEALRRAAQMSFGSRSCTRQHILQVGLGKFGQINERIPLPEDVDVQGIQASWQGENLLLLLPRIYRKQLHRPRTSFPGFGQPFSGFGRPGQALVGPYGFMNW